MSEKTAAELELEEKIHNAVAQLLDEEEQNASKKSVRQSMRPGSASKAGKDRKPLTELLSKYGHRGEKIPAHKREQMRQEEEKFHEQFPFKPALTELPSELYEGDHPHLNMSHDEHIQTLAQPRTQILKTRERKRLEREVKEFESSCSFKPTISKQRSVSPPASSNSIAGQRLYEDALKRKKSQELKDLKKEIELKKSLPFRPDVKSSLTVLKGDKAKQKPIHMRVAEIQKERQERLYQLRNDADTNNPDLKFTPTLDQKTKEIAQRKKLPVDVTERLMKDANDKMYKKIKQGEEYQSQISSECTFQPNAQLQNRSTNEILKDNELFKQVPDFTTRQAVQADIKKERHRQLVSEHWGSEDCSFSPHISKISEYLIESKGERVNETLQEKIERLSKQDMQKKQLFKEYITKSYYDSIPFAPEINTVSKALAVKSSFKDLTNGYSSKMHIQNLKDASIAKMIEEHPFHPEINERSRYLASESRYDSRGNIMDNIKMAHYQKRVEAEQHKKMKEYSEMKECTFDPKINKSMPASVHQEKLGKSVAGMEAFLEQRDRAKRLQQDKKKREEKVFHIENKYNATKHLTYTQPEPFNISQQYMKGIRDEEMRREIQEREAKTYTFKPETNETKNKRVIMSLIAEYNN